MTKSCRVIPAWPCRSLAASTTFTPSTSCTSTSNPPTASSRKTPGCASLTSAAATSWLQEKDWGGRKRRRRERKGRRGCRWRERRAWPLCRAHGGTRWPGLWPTVLRSFSGALVHPRAPTSTLWASPSGRWWVECVGQAWHNYLRGLGPSPRSDIYSLGITLWQMVSRMCGSSLA